MSAEKVLFAHTQKNSGPEAWEPLTKHLDEVADAAEDFASIFGAQAWGRWLGACHDLGKMSDAFQNYLHASSAAQDAGVEEQPAPGRVNHSSYGARFVHQIAGGVYGEMLAYCIAGHHAGLPDAYATDDAKSGGTLRFRLDPNCENIPSVADVTLALPPLNYPPRARSPQDAAFGLAFFTRMLFSCLVDADRTCTEAFCDPEKGKDRKQPRPSISQLAEALDKHMQTLAANAPPRTVNQVRADVLRQCRAAALNPPGFFSLQVPTGGGKTLASLVFALSHAGHNTQRRVIVAIPFTSIIEQTAEVYRKALGNLAESALIEHHTNLQPQYDTRANQLGAENWDAPLIVTTNVQFLESLFAAATTPCRKLHRIANSVIILDEAQVLPPELLAPALTALRMLVDHYHCTIVLCTATQPALEHRPDFEFGLKQVKPIIAEPKALFDALRRVEVQHAGKLTDVELVERLRSEEQVLCIVNTREHATKLFRELREHVGAEGCFHLSTLMYGAHRREVLHAIRQRAASGQICRVVSTQLIEAGVDLDLPVVYRAEAGFDSLAQAAGRCNREGRLPSLGRVYVFQAEKLPPAGYLRRTAETAAGLRGIYADPISPEAMDAYFRDLYWSLGPVGLDKEKVLEEVSMEVETRKTRFQFREMASKFVLIRESGLPILIPRDPEAKSLLFDLQNPHVPYVQQRKLQPYLVSIPERDVLRLEADAVLRPHESGVWILLREDAYDKDFGLKLGNIGLDPSTWGA